MSAGRSPSLVNIGQDFVPASLPNFVAATANQVTTTQSCAACHAESSADRSKILIGNKGSGHTGRRFAVELCAVCHNPGTFDPATSTADSWQTVDLKVLIHQFHGTHHYPQDAPFGGVGGIGAGWITNGKGVMNCRTCHDNQNPVILPSQPATRGVQTRHHRADRHAEHLRSLGVAELLEPDEQQDFALFVGQQGQRTRQLAEDDPGLDRGPGGGAVVVGVSCPVSGRPSLHLLRVDSRLELLWERPYPVAKGPDDAYGVAVLAETFWHAQQAARALTVEWSSGPLAGVSSASIRAEQGKRLDAADAFRVRDDGDTGPALDAAAQTLEAEYWLPYLAHATLEPMNATVWFHDGGCEAWVPSQGPDMVRRAAARLSPARPRSAPGARRRTICVPGVWNWLF